MRRRTLRNLGRGNLNRLMRLHRRLRPLVAIPLLAGVLGIAVWMPIPATGNAQLNQIVGEVRERLPGWRIVQANASWEGAYTVVAACGSRELGFQLVPEHGLPVGDSWVQPNDLYARSRLEHVSDHDQYLVWYRNPARQRSLSCRSELARDPHVQVGSRTVSSHND